MAGGKGQYLEESTLRFLVLSSSALLLLSRFWVSVMIFVKIVCQLEFVFTLLSLDARLLDFMNRLKAVHSRLVFMMRFLQIAFTCPLSMWRRVW